MAKLGFTCPSCQHEFGVDAPDGTVIAKLVCPNCSQTLSESAQTVVERDPRDLSYQRDEE